MCMQNDNLVGNVRLGKWHVGEVRRYHLQIILTLPTHLCRQCETGMYSVGEVKRYHSRFAY